MSLDREQLKAILGMPDITFERAVEGWAPSPNTDGARNMAKHYFTAYRYLKKMQIRAYDFVKAAFPGQSTDTRVRALRLLEEAIEYAQASNVDRQQAAELVLHVYSKEPGHPMQELGGVGLTFLAACNSRFVDAQTVTDLELQRAESHAPEYFTKRNQAKVDAGFK